MVQRRVAVVAIRDLTLGDALTQYLRKGIDRVWFECLGVFVFDRALIVCGYETSAGKLLVFQSWLFVPSRQSDMEPLWLAIHSQRLEKWDLDRA